MFDTTLIESASPRSRGGGWLSTLLSMAIHALAIGGLLMAGYFYDENNKVIETRIEAFMVGGAPAPPPPPPPPPATSSTPKPVTPKVETPKTQTDSFVTPTKIEDLTEVEIEESDSQNVEGGIPGGVEGGVVGGVVGGIVGGVIGGTIGGQLGGVLGGTGTSPYAVGGDVKAPVPIHRVEPGYTEAARRERIEGVVILEAIIDRTGKVTDVRVIKPLPRGLSEEAMEAVRQWKFRPGTRDGEPVPVIFTLTVNFRLG